MEVIPFYTNYRQHPDLIIKSEKKRMSLTALMIALHTEKMTDLYNLVSNYIICTQLSQAHYYNQNHKSISFQERD